MTFGDRNNLPLLLLAAMTIALDLSAGSALAQDSEDKSGTNPAVLTRAFVIGNDFRWLPGKNDRWFSNSYARLAVPFNDASMNLVFEAPLGTTNLLGGTRSEFGDASVKWNWVAHVDRTAAIVPSLKITAPTSPERAFGTGRWTAAPGLTVPLFVHPEWIVAPALVHTFSFADANGRADISRTDFDLYIVYKPKGERWWITQDLTIGRDYLAKIWPATYKAALGLNLGKLGDAAVNLSLRPGIGIGRDRPVKYSFEASLSVVGF